MGIANNYKFSLKKFNDGYYRYLSVGTLQLQVSQRWYLWKTSAFLVFPHLCFFFYGITIAYFKRCIGSQKKRRLRFSVLANKKICSSFTLKDAGLCGFGGYHSATVLKGVWHEIFYFNFFMILYLKYCRVGVGAWAGAGWKFWLHLRL